MSRIYVSGSGLYVPSGENPNIVKDPTGGYSRPDFNRLNEQTFRNNNGSWSDRMKRGTF